MYRKMWLFVKRIVGQRRERKLPWRIFLFLIRASAIPFVDECLQKIYRHQREEYFLLAAISLLKERVSSLTKKRFLRRSFALRSHASHFTVFVRPVTVL